jgi:hypothetical protein
MQVSFNVGSLIPVALEGIRLAAQSRRGKALAETESNDELIKGYELAVRFAGSILFELRDNTERIRYMVKHAETGGTSFGTFDFAISDATMPRLCEALPTPGVLHEIHAALSAVRRVDFHQRFGGTAEMLLVPRPLLGGHTLREDARGFARAVSFAKDALEKGLVDRFNRLRALTAGIGKAALGEAWDAVESNFLPAEIDPSADIDHSLI